MDSQAHLNEIGTVDAMRQKSVPQIGPDGQPIAQFAEEDHPDIENVEDGIEHSDEDVPVSPDGLQIDPRASVDKFAEPGRVRRMATVMNLLNALLGAGILGVPKSLHACGWVVSLILLLVIAVLSHIGTVMTIKLQYRTKATGFDHLALITLGNTGSLALSICTMLFCVSCMTAYLVIGGDMIMTWLRLAGITVTGTWNRAILILVYALIIPAALTIPRSIQFLSYFSSATVICIGMFFVAMIIKGFTTLPKQGIHSSIVASDLGMGLFSAMSVYGLAFALPVVILPIIQPYNKDLNKRGVISLATFIICFFLVAIPGVIGYFIFGKDVKDNVLLSFPDGDFLITLVRIGFFLVVSFSYPCIGQGILSSFSQVLYSINNHAELPSSQRLWVLICTNVIPIILAMFIPNVGTALGIGGAFGGCLADFFYPALMWFVISKKQWTHPHNLLCILFAVFGLVSAAICTYVAISDAVKAYSK